MLIHLGCELINGGLILSGGRILDDGVSVGIELDLGGLLGLLLVGTLGHAGSLRGGNHGCGCDGIKKKGVKKRSKGTRKSQGGRGERMTLRKEIDEKCKKAEWIAWRGGQGNGGA